VTNDDLKDLIHAFNTVSLPSPCALRRLTDTVTLGYIWLERPTGRTASESSAKVYFVLSGSQCVAVVREMGFAHSRNPFEEENLHWYVHEEHRGQGHLSRALQDCILPHIFSDGREQQRVTADSVANAKYVARQGFKLVGEMTYTMTKNQVDPSRVPDGQNSPLTYEERDELKRRLREAKALIISVHEKLQCHFGQDVLGLEEFARDIENWFVARVADLNERGKLPGRE
jgi:hypothetical protein